MAKSFKVWKTLTNPDGSETDEVHYVATYCRDQEPQTAKKKKWECGSLHINDSQPGPSASWGWGCWGLLTVVKVARNLMPYWTQRPLLDQRYPFVNWPCHILQLYLTFTMRYKRQKTKSHIYLQLLSLWSLSPSAHGRKLSKAVSFTFCQNKRSIRVTLTWPDTTVWVTEDTRALPILPCLNFLM